jgi:two-component system KDP operon response regulator KdpE
MRYKILLVDDEPTLIKFLGEYLEGQEMDVVTANNGPEALRTAFKEQPDLVVLDIMMPGMDGWEVVTRLRELSEMPIILLTAKNAEADKLRGFRLGVDDYVTKPFSFAELTARIQAVISRTRHPQPAENRNLVLFGEWVLDLDARELRRGGQPISLTPTEYRLLETLARQQGRAVEESALVQEVWGPTFQEDTAALRRYIFLLRQKIEPDPTRPQFILTVRGYGYRLVEGA